MTTRSGRARRRHLLGVIAGGCAIGLVAAAGNETLDLAVLSAGAFTTPEAGSTAFSIPVAMLDAEQGEAFAKGKEQFNEAWVVAPDPSGVWGLGPTFNEDRCAHCHVNNGARSGARERTGSGSGHAGAPEHPGPDPRRRPLAPSRLMATSCRTAASRTACRPKGRRCSPTPPAR